MAGEKKTAADEPFHVAPYFDVLFQGLEAGDSLTCTAFGRHVHWGYWPEPSRADGTPEDYAIAAERLCHKVTDAAGIHDGMRILDVGCGLGGTIASLNERFTGLEMVGVNIDNRQLEYARKRVKPRGSNRINFVNADACALPFASGSFDVVLAVECIFHFPSRAAFFEGAGRVLRPGGRMALSDFVPPEENLPLLRRFDPAEDEATRLSYGQVNLLCPIKEYVDLGRNVGLRLTASEDISPQTHPTYAFLLKHYRHTLDRDTARVHERATGLLEMACRTGLLCYTVVSFHREACVCAKAA